MKFKWYCNFVKNHMIYVDLLQYIVFKNLQKIWCHIKLHKMWLITHSFHIQEWSLSHREGSTACFVWFENCVVHWRVGWNLIYVFGGSWTKLHGMATLISTFSDYIQRFSHLNFVFVLYSNRSQVGQIYIYKFEVQEHGLRSYYIFLCKKQRRLIEPCPFLSNSMLLWEMLKLINNV